MDEQSRSTVPPRRELLVDQYTLAHQAAAEEKEAAGRFEGFAESAGDRRDYRAAADSWERVCRATSNALRHRRAELELRKQEYSLYNHLDDENTLLGLRLLIGYSERRLERLRDDSRKATAKARIAHLKDKILQNEYESKMMESQIISEELPKRAKGHPNNSYGDRWGQEGGGRPNFHPHRNESSQKLSWLRGKINFSNRIITQSTTEIKQNEDEWERIREKARRREPEWKKLDDEARRHWAGLPARDYEAEERELRKRRMEEAHQAARYQQEQQEAERKRQEEQVRKQEQGKTEAERQRQEQADAAAAWEEEYGNALEEDPDFMTLPTKQYSGLSLDDKDDDSALDADKTVDNSGWTTTEAPEGNNVGGWQDSSTVASGSEKEQKQGGNSSSSEHVPSGSLEEDIIADIVIDYDDDIELS